MLMLDRAIDRDLLIASPEMFVSEAIASMNQTQASYVLVVEQEQLVGIFTERDVVQLIASKVSLEGLAITEVMTQNPITLSLSPRLDIYSVFSLLRQYQIRHLPIIDDLGQPVGIINISSIGHVFDFILQSQIEEQTAELSTENAQLEQEMQECKLIQEELNENEKAWQLSQERLDSILSCLDDAVWSFNPQINKLLYLNSAVEEVYGRSLSEFFNNLNLWQDVIYPDDCAKVESAKLLLLETGSQDLEYRIVRPDGEVRWIRDRAYVIYDSDQTPIRINSIATDITQRKQLEVQLLYRTGELQGIVDNAIDFIVRFDRQLRHLFVNRALTIATGIPLENYLGKTNEEVGMPSELCEYWNRHLQEVFETGEPKEIEFEFETINGLRSFHARIVPERWESDQVETLLSITRDITKLKQVEKELKNLVIREQTARTEAEVTRKHLANTLESISDAFVALDNEWRYTYVNEKAGQLFNIRPEDLVGKNMWEQFPEGVGGTFYHVYHKALREQIFIQLEEYFPPWDRWFENRIYPTPDGLSIFFQDITDRKRTEIELQKTHQKLVFHVENSPLAVVEWHKGTYIQYWSEQAEKIFGWKAEEVVGKDWQDWQFVFEADLEFVKSATVKMLENKASRTTICNRNYTKDGSVVYCEWYNSVLFDESGNVVSILSLVQDVSDRKRAEEALAKSEELFRQLAETIDEVFFIYLMDYSQLLYISSAYEQIWGRSCESLYQQPHSWLEAVHPDDLDDVQFSLKQQNEGEGFNTEYRIIRPDGTIRWILARSFIILNSEEKAYRVVGVAKDITKRKQAELALQQLNQELEHRVKARTQELEQSQAILYEREEMFRQLAETIDECFFLHSLDGQESLYVSPAYEKIFGRNCQQLYEEPTSWLEAIHPEDCDRILAAFIRQSQYQGNIDEDHRIVRPDGTVRWVSVRTSYVFNEAGQPYRVAGIAQDITERKLAEHELEKSKRFIERIADASPNILYIFDLEEKCNIYSNRNIAIVLGYSPAEIQAMGSTLIPSLMHPDDFTSFPENIQRIYAAADGEILEFEYRMRDANGRWHWLSSRETIFARKSDGTVKQIIGAAEDISDRKHKEEQIRASLAEKEVLLREIHHRVKNNLNVIHSLLNMQARTLQDKSLKNIILDSQKRLQTMALIHEQLYQSENLAQIDFGEYLHRLVRNLFAASNLNPHVIQVEIQAEPVALNLETAIPSGLIINELLTNSFKYAFPNGQSGKICVRFHQDHDQRLHLTISDNGVGIPSDFDWDKTVSLGIRLVRILIQQLRATCEIIQQNGTSFHLTFNQIK